MPTRDLEVAINAVNVQVAQMSLRWKLYCQLFNSGDHNIDILNKSGSTIFGLTQRLMLDDIMLSLSKLTDHAKTGRYKNASIRTVLETARASLSQTSIDKVDDLIRNLETYVQNVRVHRDKFLAHADLTHALNPSTLPDVKYHELESAMETIQEIIAKVALEACRWTVPKYCSVIIPFGTGGDALLTILERGHRDEAHS